MPEHIPLNDADALLKRARHADTKTPERVAQLRALLARCPAHAPALVALGKALQLLEPQPTEATDPFEEAEQALRNAVVASGRGDAALCELGDFFATTWRARRRCSQRQRAAVRTELRRRKFWIQLCVNQLLRRRRRSPQGSGLQNGGSVL